MREAIPTELQQRMDEDPNALLTLPEFMRQAVPPEFLSSSQINSSSGIGNSSKGDQNHRQSMKARTSLSRSRSLSAPPLAWLLSRESSRPGTPGSAEKTLSRKGSKGKKSRPKSSGGKDADSLLLAQSLQGEYSSAVSLSSQRRSDGHI
jgi:ubiquitin-protein ligase E3 D